MITGDSAYTAADVAAQLGMTRGADKGVLVLEDVCVTGNVKDSGNLIHHTNNLLFTHVAARRSEKHGHE